MLFRSDCVCLCCKLGVVLDEDCVCLCCRLGVVVDEDCVCLCCRLGVVVDEDWRSGGALRRLACTRSSLISQTVLVHTRAHRHVLAACVANDLPDYLYYYCETCR